MKTTGTVFEVGHELIGNTRQSYIKIKVDRRTRDIEEMEKRLEKLSKSIGKKCRVFVDE